MDESRRPDPDTDPLSLVGEAVLEALERIDLPAYVVDREGTVRWANKAASRLTADRVVEVEAHSAGGVFVLAAPQKAGQGERAARACEEALLTPRQAEVLQLLGEGLSTEAIASRLGVAVETARNHIRAVLRGLDVHSRLEAVVAGRERGLLDE